jgi:large subunit ribosomal protein L25
VTVNVPIHLIGEAVPETLVVTENSVVSLEAEATHIPEFIEVDIEGAEVGTQVLASQLVLPEGSLLLTDDDTLIVNVTQQMSEEELEAELEEAEAEVGIEREESDVEIAEREEAEKAAAEEAKAEGESAEGEAASEGSDEE